MDASLPQPEFKSSGFSRLASEAQVSILPPMKFWLSLIVYLVMGALLSWGILIAVQPGGKPWVLLTVLAAYLVAMARNGCSETH
jgi:hypothetical protein